MKLIPALLATAALLIAADAGAEQKGGTCKNDIERLCPGVKPGGNRLMQCLTKNQSRLSPSCAATIREVQESAAKEFEPCQDDRQKFCKGVSADGGGLARCMESNSERLTPACRQKIADTKARMEQRHPCLRDIERLCRNVEPGAGRMDQCLAGHEGELSPACRERRQLIRQQKAAAGRQ
jgi:hypothetical protein